MSKSAKMYNSQKGKCDLSKIGFSVFLKYDFKQQVRKFVWMCRTDLFFLAFFLFLKIISNAFCNKHRLNLLTQLLNTDSSLNSLEHLDTLNIDWFGLTSYI